MTTDEILTKEISFIFKGRGKKAIVKVPKGTCSLANCTKRGKIFIVPILSKYDPFWLCNSHFKKFGKQIMLERQRALQTSEGYEIIWIKEGARAVTQQQAEALVPREVKMIQKKKRGRGFSTIEHKIKVHKIGDRIFVPMEWAEELFNGTLFVIEELEARGKVGEEEEEEA